MRKGDGLGKAPGGAEGRMPGDFDQNIGHIAVKFSKKK